MFSSTIEKQFWLIVFILEGIIIICCNALGVLIFAKKAQRSRPCLLLANQCFADIIVGIEAVFYICMIYSNSDVLGQHKKNPVRNEGCPDVVMVIGTALWILSFEESIINLALMALERVYAVFKPFKHRVMRKKTYLKAILATWIITITQCLLTAIPNCINMETKDVLDGIFVIIYGTVFVGGICLIGSYVAIYIKLKFFPIFQNTHHIRNEYKLCGIFFYASAVSVLSYLPISLVLFYERVTCPEKWICAPNYVHYLSMVVLFSNAFTNFFVYTWRFPGFAESIKKLIFCKNQVVDNHVHCNIP